MMNQSVFQNFRRLGFHMINQIKGGHVNLYFNDIQSIMENFKLSESRRANAINNLLAHAVKTVPYYKDYFGKTFNEFPIMNKSIYKSSINDFLSNDFKKEDLIIGTTSGSTGTPFVMFQDKKKKIRNIADTTYFASLTDFKVGDRLYYFKIWSDLNKKSKTLSFLQNIVPIEVMNLGEKEIAKTLASIEKETGRVGIIGYASALEQIAKFIKRNNLKTNIRNVTSIISISETLNLDTRIILEDYFNILPVARYSSIECGIMAQQCYNLSNEYHLNFASYHFEILDLKYDHVLPIGAVGRIVVTDLYNYGMPFIRYDTGDIGAMSMNGKCSFNTPVLTRLEGRKLDAIYNTSGELINSLFVYKNMWKYTEISQYQLIQKGIKKYVMRICKEGEFNRAGELLKEFHEYLGSDADITIEYTNEIPLLNSGKRRKVVNEYYK